MASQPSSPILDGMDQRLPLYARLADVLTKRIASGEWSPDAPLPAETTLATDDGVSVGTLRKAMQQLVDEGLLERRQGSGTFVRRARLDKSLFRFFRFAGGRAAGAVPESRIVRLRLWGGEPFLAEEIALPSSPFAALMELDLAAFGPLLYPVYERVCGQ